MLEEKGRDEERERERARKGRRQVDPVNSLPGRKSWVDEKEESVIGRRMRNG
jgi:hypothetical protein